MERRKERKLGKWAGLSLRLGVEGGKKESSENGQGCLSGWGWKGRKKENAENRSLWPCRVGIRKEVGIVERKIDRKNQ